MTIEMDVNEIRANLKASYRRHCEMVKESKPYPNVQQNYAQRKIAWTDAFFAAGLGVDEMERIEDEVKEAPNDI